MESEFHDGSCTEDTKFASLKDLHSAKDLRYTCRHTHTWDIACRSKRLQSIERREDVVSHAYAWRFAEDKFRISANQ